MEMDGHAVRYDQLDRDGPEDVLLADNRTARLHRYDKVVCSKVYGAWLRSGVWGDGEVDVQLSDGRVIRIIDNIQNHVHKECKRGDFCDGRCS